MAGGLNTYGYVGANPVNLTDPLGLWYFYQIAPSLPQPVVNAAAGFGDGISLGATKWARKKLGHKLGFANTVNECSSAYKGGKYAGWGLDAALGTAGLARAGAWAWSAGLDGGENSIFWSGAGTQSYAEGLGGTTIGQTPIGSILNSFGDFVPGSVWKAASATFANNAEGIATAVLNNPWSEGIWSTVENPILSSRGITVNIVTHFP